MTVTASPILAYCLLIQPKEFDLTPTKLLKFRQIITQIKINGTLSSSLLENLSSHYAVLASSIFLSMFFQVHLPDCMPA
jgi:hypothetical protein